MDFLLFTAKKKKIEKNLENTSPISEQYLFQLAFNLCYNSINGKTYVFTENFKKM